MIFDLCDCLLLSFKMKYKFSALCIQHNITSFDAEVPKPFYIIYYTIFSVDQKNQNDYILVYFFFLL